MTDYEWFMSLLVCFGLLSAGFVAGYVIGRAQ
jgi:hypothetical protein